MVYEVEGKSYRTTLNGIFSAHDPSGSPVRFLDATNKALVREISGVASFHVRVDVVTVLRLSSDHPVLRVPEALSDDSEYPVLRDTSRGVYVLELVAFPALLDNPLVIGKWSSCHHILMHEWVEHKYVLS